MITILWLGRQHGIFCFARLVFHITPPSESGTRASAWDTGRITKKANNLGEYGEIWKVFTLWVGYINQKVAVTRAKDHEIIW